MKLRIVDFRDALAVINSTEESGQLKYPVLFERYNEFIGVLEKITDEEIIKLFNEEQDAKQAAGKSRVKSISIAINNLIKRHMSDYPEWEAESYIFEDSDYKDKVPDGTEWRLDFASEGALAVEVAFNHGEAIAWNLSKLVMSSELNHVQKAINTKIGVYVCATNAMKEAGNFDSASGSFEKVLRYLKPMRNILTAPMVLIGLEAPNSFVINKDTREVEYIKHHEN